MAIELLRTDPLLYVVWVATVIVSVTLHELGHVHAAIAQGDDTPVRLGHLTWNPLVHMGLFSLLLCLTIGVAFGATPVTPSRFRGRYGRLLVSMAGPAVNLALALIVLTGAGVAVRLQGPGALSAPLMTPALIFGQANLMLAAFNSLPVPPLDGSEILRTLFPSLRRPLGNPDLQPFFFGAFVLLFVFAGPLLRAVDDVATTWVRWIAGL